MKNYYLCVLFTIATLSFFACNSQREASDLLQQAQSLVDTQPEKALQLIDSIFYPERSLSRRQHMSYLVTRVQIRHRNSLPIDEDTFIFTARDYFARRNNDVRQTALAFFYSGRVYREQGYPENAMEHYRRAVTYAAKINDVDLQGLIHFNIGDLLLGAGLHLEALREYKKAEQFFANSLLDIAIERQANSFSAIGRMYVLLGQIDNGFTAFYKGLELARRSENNELLRLLNQNIFVGYLQIGGHDNAESHLRKAFELNNNIANLPRYYLNFARLFTNTNQIDSLNVYVEKLRQSVEQSDDLFFKVAAYDFLASNAKELGNLESTIDYLLRSSDIVNKIHERRLAQSVYEAQQRFNFERLQNIYNQRIIGYMRWIIVLLFVALVSVVLLVVFKVRQHKKREEVSQKINTLMDMNHDLESIIVLNRNDLDTLNEKIRMDMRKEFLWRFSVAEKALEVNKKKKTDDIGFALSDLNKILYGTNNIDELWKPLFLFFNQERPGLYEKIKTKYPSLTETELRICILSYGNLSVRKIALILGQKDETIQTRRSELRKKIELPKDMTIPDFLDFIYFSKG